MKKFFIVLILIWWYSRAIKKVKHAADWYNTMIRMRVDWGVCNTAAYLLGLGRLNLSPWVHRNKTVDHYWAEKPDMAEYKAQAIERLQIRLDILKKELWIWN